MLQVRYWAAEGCRTASGRVWGSSSSSNRFRSGCGRYKLVESLWAEYWAAEAHRFAPHHNGEAFDVARDEEALSVFSFFECWPRLQYAVAISIITLCHVRAPDKIGDGRDTLLSQPVEYHPSDDSTVVPSESSLSYPPDATGSAESVESQVFPHLATCSCNVQTPIHRRLCCGSARVIIAPSSGHSWLRRLSRRAFLPARLAPRIESHCRSRHRRSHHHRTLH